ncbi:GNAT family N-acetyltransferase [Heyndrickxia acidiproducens]|uniref:GNAT family N-acetyltransferase n=1 Tax=Heyndrickxia acidiproducens TaxID=1121084 RepID=UPI0003783607|nr:GNAT family N-acetyltransferase [Heyndrickxia acidiproducens]
MEKIHLQKFEPGDFDDYFELFSNQDVMAMITERALPIEEAKQNFQKVLERNKQFEQFGTFKVYGGRKKFIRLGSLIINDDRRMKLKSIMNPEETAKVKLYINDNAISSFKKFAHF